MPGIDGRSAKFWASRHCDVRARRVPKTRLNPPCRRWLNADPAGLAGGINLYEYAGNSPTNFIDPLGLDIAVIWNGPTKDNPIGHVAIAVTGSGTWSYYNHTTHGSSLGGYLQRELPRRDSVVYVIPTSPAQDAAAIAAFKKSEKAPYSTLRHNCADVANDALDAAGVPLPGFTNALPGADPALYLPFDPGETAERAAEAPGAVQYGIPKNGPISTATQNALRQFEPKGP